MGRGGGGGVGGGGGGAGRMRTETYLRCRAHTNGGGGGELNSEGSHTSTDARTPNARPGRPSSPPGPLALPQTSPLSLACGGDKQWKPTDLTSLLGLSAGKSWVCSASALKVPPCSLGGRAPDSPRRPTGEIRASRPLRPSDLAPVTATALGRSVRTEGGQACIMTLTSQELHRIKIISEWGGGGGGGGGGGSPTGNGPQPEADARSVVCS
ncbi:unnamed protein product [Gadus morhua 'NCC']